jgi:hypothetical protein
MESWAWVLLIVAIVIVSFYTIKVLTQIWARSQYQYLKTHPATCCDIDTFVNVQRNPVNAVKCVLAHYMQVGSKFSTNRPAEPPPPLSLEFHSSPHVPGLYVSSHSRNASSSISNSNNSSTPSSNTTGSPIESAVVPAEAAAVDISQLLSNMTTSSSSSSSSTKLPIVVCTIRMGFGHHRLAYSVSSWAMSTGHPTIFHDLLNIDSRTSVQEYIYIYVCVCVGHLILSVCVVCRSI